MRHLAGGIERKLLPAAVPRGDHAAPFNRRHALPRGADFARDLDRGVERLGETGIDEGFEKDVVGPVFVQARRVRLARLQHVVHGRQFLDIERNGNGHVLGLGAGIGETHRHQLADIADFLARQDRLLGDLEAAQRRHRADRLHAVAREIGCREHRLAQVVRHGDTADARVRHRATHKGDVLHSGKADIGDDTGRARASAGRLPCAAGALQLLARSRLSHSQ